ncbi:hypothetical protein D3C83_156710 [compost metagenome]
MQATVILPNVNRHSRLSTTSISNSHASETYQSSTAPGSLYSNNSNAPEAEITSASSRKPAHLPKK